MKHLVPSPLSDVTTWQRAHSGTKIEDEAHLSISLDRQVMSTTWQLALWSARPAVNRC